MATNGDNDDVVVDVEVANKSFTTNIRIIISLFGKIKQFNYHSTLCLSSIEPFRFLCFWFVNTFTLLNYKRNTKHKPFSSTNNESTSALPLIDINIKIHFLVNRKQEKEVYAVSKTRFSACLAPTCVSCNFFCPFGFEKKNRQR